MGFIRNTIGRAADKFVPWAREMERAEAHRAEIARLRAARNDASTADSYRRLVEVSHGSSEPEAESIEAPRTMADITNDYNAGMIGYTEFESQRTQRATDLAADYETFRQEMRDAPEIVLTDQHRAAVAALAPDTEHGQPQGISNVRNPAEFAEHINRLRDREHVGPSDIEAEQAPGGPLWNPETGEPYDAATTERLINEARYPDAGPYWTEPTPADFTAGLARVTAQDMAARQADYAALPEDTRARYLGDRAAEVAEAAGQGHQWDVVARMLRDGITDGDLRQVAQTSAEWATTAQAQPSEPELSTAVQVTTPDGDRFVSRDPDLAGVQRAYPAAQGYSCEVVTGQHNAEPEADAWDGYEGAQTVEEAAAFAGIDLEELEAGTDPENADQADLNTPDDEPDEWHEPGDAPGEWWAGPTEEYPTVQAWADAHPEQPAGDLAGLGWGIGSRHRPEPDLTDAQLAAEAVIDDAVSAMDHAPGWHPGGSGSHPMPAPEEPNICAAWRSAVLEVPGFLAAPSAEDAAASWDEPLPESVDLVTRQSRTVAQSHIVLGSPEWEEANETARQLDVNPLGYEGQDPPPRTLADLPDVAINYELTELGAAQAVADQVNEREVGPGYLAAPVAEAEAGA